MKNKIIAFIILIIILFIVPDIVMLFPVPYSIYSSSVVELSIYYFLKILFIDIAFIIGYIQYIKHEE